MVRPKAKCVLHAQKPRPAPPLPLDALTQVYKVQRSRVLSSINLIELNQAERKGQQHDSHRSLSYRQNEFKFYSRKQHENIRIYLRLLNVSNKHTPWPESASEQYRPSLSAKLVPTLADRGMLRRQRSGSPTAVASVFWTGT
jgi:hypothetical protein